MLDKNEVLRQLKEIVPQVTSTINEEITILKDCVVWLSNNPDKLPQLFEGSDIVGENNIIQSIELKEYGKPYRILGVDGSQIYPDKHQGLNCYLLNIGFAGFSYSEQSLVRLKSFPFIYFENEINDEFSHEIVNYLRTEMELKKGFEYSNTLSHDYLAPFICLFDGPLYFWYLNNKTEKVKNRFFSSYLKILNQFYTQSIPLLGFLSSPKNKELIALLEKGLSKKIIDLGYDCSVNFKFVTDSDFVSLFLKPYTRTPLFTLCSNLSLSYPSPLRPRFCYINVGEEISRIELPAWLGEDSQLTKCLTLVTDQCKKGNGYPIALSEAHEQAVVKSSDRDFFYSLLHTISGEQNHSFNFSQKSIKKKVVAV